MKINTKELTFKKIFYDKTDSFTLQTVRYLFVGALCFTVDFTILFLLTHFAHLHYLISALFSFIAAININYYLSTKWVFSRRSMKNRTVEIVVFLIISLVGLGLNELFMWFFTDILAIFYLLSKIITTFLVYFWNFLSRKLILYK